MAISGLHVGIVAFILGLLLKVLRLRRRARYLVIILLLAFYCLLTGARPSVIRATIMAVVLLVGFLLRREISISHSLALVIALGFSLLIVGIAAPFLAPVFAASANLSIVILIQIVKLFSQIPGGYFYL